MLPPATSRWLYKALLWFLKTYMHKLEIHIPSLSLYFVPVPFCYHFALTFYHYVNNKYQKVHQHELCHNVLPVVDICQL